MCQLSYLLLLSLLIFAVFCQRNEFPPGIPGNCSKVKPDFELAYAWNSILCLRHPLSFESHELEYTLYKCIRPFCRIENFYFSITNDYFGCQLDPRPDYYRCIEEKSTRFSYELVVGSITDTAVDEFRYRSSVQGDLTLQQGEQVSFKRLLGTASHIDLHLTEVICYDIVTNNQ